MSGSLDHSADYSRCALCGRLPGARWSWCTHCALVCVPLFVRLVLFSCERFPSMPWLQKRVNAIPIQHAFANCCRPVSVRFCIRRTKKYNLYPCTINWCLHLLPCARLSRICIISRVRVTIYEAPSLKWTHSPLAVQPKCLIICVSVFPWMRSVFGAFCLISVFCVVPWECRIHFLHSAKQKMNSVLLRSHRMCKNMKSIFKLEGIEMNMRNYFLARF